MALKKGTVLPILVLALVSAGVAQEKGGNDETGPYEVVPNWPQPLHGTAPGSWGWGRTASVWAESADRVFVFQDGELPILERPIGDGGVPVRPAASAADRGEKRMEHILLIVDREGKLLDAWEQHNHLFVRPHSVKINPYDPERHVWLIDDGAHSVYKFTNDGKQLVMRLGEFKVPANDEKHFGRPTSIAFFPNGDFVISDGYVNTRVIKFNKDGKYLTSWGMKGEAGSETRPGYMNTVHGIAVDKQGRVYVSDRSNRRIQVFDANGRHLDTWANIRFPLSIAMSADQHLWVNDGLAQKFLKFDLSGRLLYSWGTFGGEPGQMWGVHGFSVDNEGNLYTAEVWGGRAQKFRPKRFADRSKLIGPLFDTTPASARTGR
jgi:sugar lactone lactonase YvrE